MTIDYTYLKAHALSALKLAQRQFNKNPNSTNWTLLTHAMLVHQQVTALRIDRNIGHLCERLGRTPLGDWAEVIVRHATGLTVRDILTQHA
jgi:hypothetical protein